MNAAIEQTEAQATQLDQIVDIFATDGRKAAPAVRPAEPRGLQQKLKSVAKAYLSHGNAAVKADDWSEF
ncbi:hypothetical protein D9M68_969090 [compost metagenome]